LGWLPFFLPAVFFSFELQMLISLSLWSTLGLAFSQFLSASTFFLFAFRLQHCLNHPSPCTCIIRFAVVSFFMMRFKFSDFLPSTNIAKIPVITLWRPIFPCLLDAYNAWLPFLRPSQWCPSSPAGVACSF